LNGPVLTGGAVFVWWSDPSAQARWLLLSPRQAAANGAVGRYRRRRRLYRSGSAWPAGRQHAPCQGAKNPDNQAHGVIEALYLDRCADGRCAAWPLLCWL